MVAQLIDRHTRAMNCISRLTYESNLLMKAIRKIVEKHPGASAIADQAIDRFIRQTEEIWAP